MPNDSSDGLIFDDRPHNSRPGLHALLIGVSGYPYLSGGPRNRGPAYGLGQLSAPARTVKDIAGWLIARKDKLTAPLKTCRLLASPSSLERHADQPITGVPPLAEVAPATLDTVLSAAAAWRTDASVHPQDVTLFYFAGHGIQRSRGDSVLLLEDFLGGRTLLDRAINVNNIYNGMANFLAYPNTARTQFFFVDACRADIRQLREFVTPETTAVFDVELGGVDDRVAPIFFAAAAGHETYGIRGEQTLFGRDFLNCLNGKAGDRVLIGDQKQWVVNIGTLARSLNYLTEHDNQKHGIPYRSFNIDKYTTLNTAIHYLDQAPLVECEFFIEPDVASRIARIRCLDARQKSAHRFRFPVKPNPYTFEIPAGGYTIEAGVAKRRPKGLPSYSEPDPDIITVTPPTFHYALRYRERS
ncbi:MULTISPECIES: caspase family protein [Azospirillum]|uniref:Caspase family protein n=1 Tax=Azospirillum brasilense TaxID=192 RepID=A0A0P0EPW2_AZOBR|nr:MULTISPECIES: caspase family protein [Azospirillum]ALJ36343.1 hypothetical protein AMK58_13480 [Azospirillum brasilense]MDW7557797.1 caspase family protein [Azospirillum brasilense]MDW7597431.1 caspase family protein [Azospirillum brasilense]MDW7632694.1 caspase family protein [Azospirillum brasilense]MDX5952437.1 caspase family protein [Azospirillum brasilense]